MEPREEDRKVEERRPEEQEPKRQRFRVVRLEERIAPSIGAGRVDVRPPTSTLGATYC